MTLRLFGALGGQQGRHMGAKVRHEVALHLEPLLTELATVRPNAAVLKPARRRGRRCDQEQGDMKKATELNKMARARDPDHSGL